jgi:hypothetical protein
MAITGPVPLTTTSKPSVPGLAIGNCANAAEQVSSSEKRRKSAVSAVRLIPRPSLRVSIPSSFYGLKITAQSEHQMGSVVRLFEEGFKKILGIAIDQLAVGEAIGGEEIKGITLDGGAALPITPSYRKWSMRPNFASFSFLAYIYGHIGMALSIVG